jgi:hypothetical protein
MSRHELQALLSGKAMIRAVVITLAVTVGAGCAQIDALEKRGLELREDRLAREKGSAAATTTSENRPQSDSNELCEKFRIDSALDVDTAYVRAMAKFNFASPETIKRDADAVGNMTARGLRHDKTQGVLYVISMGSTVQIANGSRVSPRYNMSIANDGQGKSRITGDYCYFPNAYGRSQVGDIRPELTSMLQATFAR